MIDATQWRVDLDLRKILYSASPRETVLELHEALLSALVNNREASTQTHSRRARPSCPYPRGSCCSREEPLYCQIDGQDTVCELCLG
jgi:hypothetical protein